MDSYFFDCPPQINFKAKVTKRTSHTCTRTYTRGDKIIIILLAA